MRLAPVIPLLGLGLGVGLVESFSLHTSTEGRNAATFTLGITQVQRTTADASLSFAAQQLTIDDTGLVAANVLGEITQADHAHSFVATSVSQAIGQQSLELAGNVEIWYQQRQLQTAQAFIDKNGSIHGSAVVVREADNEISADAFFVDPNGAISLKGDVRARLSRE